MRCIFVIMMLMTATWAYAAEATGERKLDEKHRLVVTRKEIPPPTLPTPEPGVTPYKADIYYEYAFKVENLESKETLITWNLNVGEGGNRLRSSSGNDVSFQLLDASLQGENLILTYFNEGLVRVNVITQPKGGPAKALPLNAEILPETLQYYVESVKASGNLSDNTLTAKVVMGRREKMLHTFKFERSADGTGVWKVAGAPTTMPK